jgi:CO/xanthine dehydrogenase Mo-binding subunit
MTARTQEGVGHRVARRDAEEKVKGTAPYSDDLNLPGQLHLAVRFSDKPHARFTLDTSEAETMPGVVQILTAADVPRNAYGMIEDDQQVLADGYVRCVMDRLALVVAETREQAKAAAAAIKVQYEELPILDSVEAARAENAPQLHAHRPGNMQYNLHIEKGDLSAGFAQAAVIVEGTYQTHPQEHAYLQPEAGVAFVDETGRVVVRTSAQWVQDDHRQIIGALGLAPEQVIVEYVYTGGAFGGKEDISIQILLALATWKLQRPVKLVWSREESIRGHHKRHPAFFKTRWGATAEGKICAVETEILVDSGAYASSSQEVLKVVTLCATGPYEVPNLKVDGYLYLTNNLVNGAFRSFGALQAAFCYEMQIEKIARALGLDSVEVRARNLYRDGSIEPTGNVVPAGVGALEALESAAKAAGWTYSETTGWQRPVLTQPADSTKRRGLGIACAYKNVGYSFGYPERSCAEIEIQGAGEIEQVIVRHSAAEVGQGISTALAQVVAETLNLPLSKIRLSPIMYDNNAPLSGSASASRLAMMAGQAVKKAAEKALEQWLGEQKPPVKAYYEYRAPTTTAPDPETGACVPNFSYGYAAQAAEIEVDLETGLLKVLKVISANDVGRALNPQNVEGQIEGAIAQGLGWAITEDFQMLNGQVRTRNFTEYLIPTVMDMPPTETHIIEKADPNGPFGARGVGEMGMLGVAPAINLALQNATEVWIDALPLTPERVYFALHPEEGQ